MKNKFIAGAIATLVALSANSSVFAQEVSLRFAHYGATGDSADVAADRFAELVSEKTGGDVEVRVFGDRELGDSRTMIEGVRIGTIDMALAGNVHFTGFLPELNILDLPYIFENDAHAFEVMDGAVGRELLGKLESTDLHGLAFWEIGFRHLTNSVRPIQNPEDLKGLKIRTTANPAHILAFDTLGANPTPMPFAEVYSALQTGTIDGQENPTNHIYANRLHEVQDYMSLTRHAFTAAPLVVNATRWNGLSAEHQSAIQNAALEAAAFERDLNDQKDAESLAAMKDSGTAVIENPNVEAFREAVVDVTREAYIEQFGTEMLDRIDALKSDNNESEMP